MSKPAVAVEPLSADAVRITVTPERGPLAALLGRQSAHPSTFVVSPAGIQPPSGSLIPAEAIHRLVLRNTEARVKPADPHCTPAELEAADRSLDRSARRAWRVWVEAGRQSTTLAVGLNQATAYAVISEIGRVLGVPI
jgi:hypothetical protein